MKTRLLLLGSLVVGCGDGGGGKDLAGIYVLEDANGCLVAFSFQRDGDYGFSLQCELQSGSTGAEVESGTYTADDDVITLMPSSNTCDDADLEPYAVGYRIYGNGDLFIANRDFAAEFVKIPKRDVDSAGTTGGVLELGCWYDDEFVTRR